MKKNLVRMAFCIVLSAVMVFFYQRHLTQDKPAFALAQAQKTIYLTFDDGPSDSTTPFILDVLKEEQVPATFFIIGRQAKRRENLIRRIQDEGHSIGIHSYSHIYSEIYRSPEALQEDIQKCSDVLEGILGYKPQLYRFPGGSFCVRDELKECVKALGYSYIDWNASCRDAELINASVEELVQSALSTSADRQTIVMLFHDSAHKNNTVWALKEIIRYYKDAGYAFEKL
ncbi:MAG: polysaccharide deacetylase [Clostridia bacterium]|nr:polysaccharide deacetylase [Clostridia bacterium]